ncbi:hypothetical protein R50072_38000 [Simiduia litorea]|uniref:hypothetical protein n=1 Tax=Simiduia litorea TaxID=1435348 RepID=UPI0036F43B92
MYKYPLVLSFALFSGVVSADDITDSISKSAAEQFCGSKEGPIFKRAKKDSEIEECKVEFAKSMTQCSEELYPQGAIQAITAGVEISVLIDKLDECTGNIFESTEWYKKFVLLRVVNG